MEQQTKHTPGPWTVRYGSGIDFRIESETYGTVCVSKFPSPSAESMDEHEEEQKANAQLIAEAPTTAAERDSLKEEVKGLEAQLRASKHDTGIFKGERDKLKEEVEEATKINNHLRSELKFCDDKISKLKEENERLTQIKVSLLESLIALYLSEYQGNSPNLDDCMARAPKSNEFEQNIIATIKKAQA